MKNTVGKNIVKLRKEQGMSQEQLAQKIHVTRQAVSNWETGRSQPDLDMLETLASAFGTDILVVIYGQIGLIPHSDSVRTASGCAKNQDIQFHALYPAADIRHASYKCGICCQPDACAECGRHCTDS